MLQRLFFATHTTSTPWHDSPRHPCPNTRLDNKRCPTPCSTPPGATAWPSNLTNSLAQTREYGNTDTPGWPTRAAKQTHGRPARVKTT
eukprot:4198762-Lingulodinium_polyedra.AAC.1